MSKNKKEDIKFIKVNSPMGNEKIELTIKGDDGKIIKIIKPNVSIIQDTKNEIALRDENVQEILTSIPHWMIRWGNVLFLLLVMLILFLSWLIKYPDVVNASIEIEKSKKGEIYIGKVTSKNYNFEKVKKGQVAHLSLVAYPEYENGIILGTVDTIFWDKTSKHYVTKINLSKKLITSYGIQINPDTNLEGFVNIIVADKRLINSFFRFK